jgi:hypothetical protein
MVSQCVEGAAGTLPLPIGSIMGLYGAPFTPERIMTTFQFRDDPIRTELELGVDAQTAGEELDRIRKEHGTLEPGTVVDESRPDEAPLHPAFEWHDPKAAELYREHQAKDLIKRVRVVVQPRNPEPVVSARADIPEGEYHDLPVSDYDPLQFELSEALGAVVQAHRLVEQLRTKAARRNDARKRVAADVAAASLESAEEAVADAEEALQNVHTPRVWHKQSQPVAAH